VSSDIEFFGWTNQATWRLAAFIGDDLDEKLQAIAIHVPREEQGDAVFALLMSWLDFYIELHCESTVDRVAYLAFAHDAFLDWLSDVNFEEIAEVIVQYATTEGTH
jgi:hypothetical protein